MWKNFDVRWMTTCAYHRDQAVSISKAVSEQLFAVEEGMSELRNLSSEREKCKECS